MNTNADCESGKKIDTVILIFLCLFFLHCHHNAPNSSPPSPSPSILKPTNQMLHLFIAVVFLCKSNPRTILFPSMTTLHFSSTTVHFPPPSIPAVSPPSPPPDRKMKSLRLSVFDYGYFFLTSYSNFLLANYFGLSNQRNMNHFLRVCYQVWKAFM